jgi:uncharacterized membrane protein YoaK (UPF0700 family)
LRDSTRFGLGVLLTAVAGWVDAIGFISLGGFYVSFMSGNTTQLGIALTRSEASLVWLPAVLVACFILGAFAATMVTSLSGRWNLPAILLLEGLLLGCALALSFVETPFIGATAPLALAMGTQNAALRSEHGHRIGGTFVTGTVFGLGEKLALWCLGQASPRPAFRHVLGWAALAIGAAAGTWTFSSYGLLALALPAGLVLILSLATALMTLRAGAAPAAQEGPNQPG